MRISALLSFLSLMLGVTAAHAQQPAAQSAASIFPGNSLAPALSLLSTIQVKKIVFTGNTAVSTDELKAIAQRYENRELPMEELENLRQELSRLYMERGFINSGVLIRDQKVENGVLQLTVMEGELKQVDIEGLLHYNKSFFTSRVLNGGGKPLNIVSLQEALQLLQQDSRIKRINAELVPGTQPGEARLKVKIAENSPYLLQLRSNNDGTPSTGTYRGELSMAHQNLLGIGDTLAADFGITEGTKDVSTSYTLPLTTRDTTFSVYYHQSDSSVTEELFKSLDIKSDARTMGVRLRQPLYKSLNNELALNFAGEWRESASTLLGRKFSFSPGEEDGKSRVSVLRIGQEYVRRGTGYLVAVHSTFNYGIAALDSTTNKGEPDSRFLSWLGQLVLLGKLGGTSLELMSRTNAQMSWNSLLPLEKFGAGGLNSVRGYRKNTLVRDNGVNSTLELRIPLINDEKGWGHLQLAPFADVGWAWNTDISTPVQDYIAGIGIGVRWNLWDRLNLEAYYAHALEKITYSKEELADKGFHFQLTVTVF